MEVRLTFPEVYARQRARAAACAARCSSAAARSRALLQGPRGAGLGRRLRLLPPRRRRGVDARYLLEEDDGTLILLTNKGYLWGRKPDTMQRLRDWAFAGGAPVGHEESTLRGNPTFEVPSGQA